MAARIGNSEPALSVVMPSLNQRAFIGSAVRSAMAQGGDELELVVMDGASTDGTQAELAALSAEFVGRLRWFSQPDEGPADAIHRAVEAARAPVVGWLNSDDLYTQGAVGRALAHLFQHPEHVMVYGHGEHVDVAGTLMARYPTLPPSTPLHAFADGCFICQPTVFFHRDAYFAVGGLDTSLRTAFDFDLWLRMFKAYPGRIGFIDAVQAQSRLHEGGITLRMREQVALEALTVIRRHVGPAPAHWLLTHVSELCAQHPFHAEVKDLRTECARLASRARDLLAPGELEELLRGVAADWRVQLSKPHVYVSVHADGWAGETLELRVRQPDPPLRCVRLACVSATPGGASLRLRIMAPDGPAQVLDVSGNGPFEVTITLADRRPGAHVLYRVETEGFFVPAEVEPHSTDHRRLAFRVEAVEAF